MRGGKSFASNKPVYESADVHKIEAALKELIGLQLFKAWNIGSEQKYERVS